MAHYKEINGLARQFNAVLEWAKRFDLKFIAYRLKWNFVAKYDHVTKFPLHLDLEVTEDCNLKCVMCPHGTTGVPTSGRMDMAAAKNLIDQAAKGGTESIKFNWRGEPSLHDGLAELVAYAKKQGIQETQINTNGLRYTDKRIEALIDAGLDRVIFSVDGATKETYESIRVQSNFVKVVANIKKFHEIRGSRVKPFIRIQMVRQKENAHEVKALIDMWKDYADDIAIKDVSDRGQGNTYSGDQIAIGRKRCNQPWQRMIVSRDLTVFPCCSDWNGVYPIGDAKSQALKDIWKGKPMEDLRQANREVKLDEHPLCKDCFVSTSFEWRKMTPEERAARK